MTDVDNFLAHYGVLGMHWGKRKSTERASKKERLKREDQKILEARSRQKARRLDVKNAVNRLESATTLRGQRAAEKAYENARVALLKNPDVATARKTTNGELRANLIIAGVAGLTSIGLITAEIVTRKR